ncbi:MAG: hypothetical protein IJD51_05950 [Clostridia bacterium]|nr:hypothetical protein [Clostridia bacterium]
MKKKTDNRAKLLIGIVNKQDELNYTSAVNKCCTAVHFSGVGHGTARSSYLSYFGINDIEKRVVFSIIPEALEKTVLRTVGQELKLYLLGRGIAFTAPLSGISNIVEDAVLSGTEDVKTAPQKKENKTMHELVIAVVDQRFTDMAIDAARAAGATGATVFHTKSLDNAKIEEKMGTILPEQSDSVFFLTTEEYKLHIMEAIRDVAGLKTEGSAVIFSLPVDDLVGIGKFDGEVPDGQ